MSVRKTHWEHVYQTKIMDSVSWFQQDPALSLTMIDSLDLKHDQAIIDIGGGTSALTARLLARAYTNLSVLDISGRALELAQADMNSDASRVHWIEADVTEFSAPQQYALWHDRAVFHFLTDSSDRRAYIDVLHKALLPNGHVIIAAFAMDGPRRCSGLDTMQYDGVTLSSALGAQFILIEEREEIHRTPSGGEQKFAWFLFRHTPQ